MYQTINSMKKITKNTKWKHTIFFCLQNGRTEKNLYLLFSQVIFIFSCVTNHFENTVRNIYLFLNQFGPRILFNEHLKKLSLTEKNNGRMSGGQVRVRKG
jgi:hypothetical protein